MSPRLSARPAGAIYVGASSGGSCNVGIVVVCPTCSCPVDPVHPIRRRWSPSGWSCIRRSHRRTGLHSPQTTRHRNPRRPRRYKAWRRWCSCRRLPSGFRLSLPRGHWSTGRHPRRSTLPMSPYLGSSSASWKSCQITLPGCLRSLAFSGVSGFQISATSWPRRRSRCKDRSAPFWSVDDMALRILSVNLAVQVVIEPDRLETIRRAGRQTPCRWCSRWPVFQVRRSCHRYSSVRKHQAQRRPG